MKQTDHPNRAAAKILTSESAPRAKNPHEHLYMGILPTDDALLRSKGAGDIDFYRALVADDAVFSCLQKRTLAQISRPWSVIPAAGVEADGEIADILTQALTRARINAACETLMEALITGFSVLEILWTYEQGYWLPARFIQRDPSRFVWTEHETVGARFIAPATSANHAGLELRIKTRADMIRGEVLPPRKFIVHQCRTRDGNPNGESLGRQLYWPVYFKKRAVIAWNKLNDRFGSPTPWGRYPRNASAEEKTTLAAALAAFSNDGYIATPEGTMIELLASSMTGNVTSQRELCNYMDDAIAAIILGKERVQNNGGAQAAAAIEREAVRLELVRADAELICDTLTSTVIAWACELNGWPPHQFTRPVTPNIDRESESRADATIASMGFQLSLDAVREKYGEGWNEAPTVAAQNVGAQFIAPAASFATAAGNGQHATSADAAIARTDADIEHAIAGELAEWEPLLDPLVDPVQALFDRAKKKGWTAQQLIDALPDVLEKMDIAPLADGITQAAATARVAGQAQ